MSKLAAHGFIKASTRPAGLVAVSLIGLLLTLLASRTFLEEETRSIRQEIERRADLRHALLRASLREYEYALFALRLLVQHSDNLTDEEFAHAAGLLMERTEGLQAVQWAPLLPAAELAGLAARLPAHVVLRERDDAGRLRPLAPSPDRPEHAIILYCQPAKGNESALGYDILTAPTAPMLASAREQPGSAALSAPFELAQGGPGMVCAVYVPRDTPGVPAPEGGPGFVQLVFRLDSALSQFFRLSANAVHDTLIVDVTDGPRPLFFQHPGQAAPSVPPADLPLRLAGEHTTRRELRFGGRSWLVYFEPTAQWLASRRSGAPWLTLAGGILGTGLAVAYLHTLARRTRRISEEVEQRTAELAESRALLNEIIDHNPSNIWVKDTLHRYQLVNLGFAFAYNRPRSEILGQTDDILHPPETVRQMHELDDRIAASGETVSFEASYPMPGGTRTYLVSKFPLRRPDSAIYAVAGIATDITDLRAAEASQLAVERKLHEARKLESLGLLAGGVAHDFNNLLTGILGHANLVRAQLAPDHALQVSLAQIETASHRAADLCRQMLAYSGHGRVAVQPVDLGALAHETANLVRLSFAKGARLAHDLHPRLPKVVVDATQIRQVVMNLLINASESLDEGVGTITVRTSVAEASPELFAACVFAPEKTVPRYVVLEISDTGRGMPPGMLERIFDPFFTTKFTGRGLGLASVLGIVRGHQGALQVISSPGLGTTFRIYLPIEATV